MLDTGCSILDARYWILDTVRNRFQALSQATATKSDRSISNQRAGFRGSMFKGSEFEPLIDASYRINGIGKKREAINPER